MIDRITYRQDNRRDNYRTIVETIEIDQILEQMTPNRYTRIGVRVEKDKGVIVITILEV